MGCAYRDGTFGGFLIRLSTTFCVHLAYMDCLYDFQLLWHSTEESQLTLGES